MNKHSTTKPNEIALQEKIRVSKYSAGQTMSAHTTPGGSSSMVATTFLKDARNMRRRSIPPQNQNPVNLHRNTTRQSRDADHGARRERLGEILGHDFIDQGEICQVG